MTSLKDSSFLDAKLQSNLAKSLRVQSQLRVPASKDSIAGIDARKSVFIPGLSIRHARNSTIATSDSQMVQMIKKLIDQQPDVFQNIALMLPDDHFSKLISIKAAKLGEKKPTIEEKPRVSSPRKARRILKEDLLYSSNKGTNGGQTSDHIIDEEIADLFDYEQLTQEIENLRAEKAKLSADIHKCDQFVHLKSSSLYFRFQYLLTKLHSVRKCTTSSKTSLLTADYFSIVLDQRRDLLLNVQEELSNMERILEHVRSTKEQLNRELSLFLAEIDEVDKETTALHSQGQHPHAVVVHRGSCDDRRLQILDDKLQAIIVAMRERAVSLSPQRQQLDKDREIDGKLDVDPHVLYDPAVTIEDVARGSAHHFQQFKQNVGDVMERCFRLSEERLKRLESSRQQILDDADSVSKSSDKSSSFNSRIVQTLSLVEKNSTLRHTSLERMVNLERDLRSEAERSFEERAKNLLDAVAQSEVVTINQLKGHYNALYAKSPSRARRRSTLLL